MRILIAGGLGFIGTNLAIDLLKKGNEVVIVDDLSSGQKSNFEIVNKYGNPSLLIHDVVNPLEMDKFDRIYNLACEASPQFYQSNPLQTIKTCVVGTMNLLEIARKCNAKFLQASTSEVYGNPLQHPQKESYLGNVSCTGIRACYDEGKRCAESIVMEYNRIYGVDTKIVRIFNTYGEFMRPDDGRVISNFIIQSLNHIPFTIYGDGEQTRSVCYVSDLLCGFELLLNSNYHNPVNLGNDEEYTVFELAKIVSEIANVPFDVDYYDLPEDDPVLRKPDLSLAKELLRYEPKISVVQGIKKTFEYFKGRMNK